MKLHEAATFLSAFKNQRAREFVRQMMITNYTEAILEHHPKAHLIERRDISEKCTLLCQTIFHKIGDIQENPHRLVPLIKKLARNNNRQASFWFDEFDVAYESYKHWGKLKKKSQQIIPYLQGNTYCDIGCGGGDLVAFLKQNHCHFKEYTGIDVLDWRTENVKNMINFQLLDFSLPNTLSEKKYDMATCIAVLHHVGNTHKSQGLFLRNVRSLLSSTGRLLVEEDVILPLEEIASNDGYKMQAGHLAEEQANFSEYIGMNREDQRCILTIIDLMANSLFVGVQNMAFPFGFKSLVEWEIFFVECNYTVEDVRINGFTKGMFNQSSHVLFILSPN